MIKKLIKAFVLKKGVSVAKKKVLPVVMKEVKKRMKK
ncbi:hypothetical protein FIU87_05940 [Bacillus sp. THAF10]|nr:hypothetical protein FIU87_05940 [Bacillus sp. THAF10]